MGKLLNPLTTSDEDKAKQNQHAADDDTARPRKKLIFISALTLIVILMMTVTLEREIEPARARLRAMSLQEATFRGRLIRLLCRGRACFADDMIGAGQAGIDIDPGSKIQKRRSAMGGRITVD